MPLIQLPLTDLPRDTRKRNTKRILAASGLLNFLSSGCSLNRQLSVFNPVGTVTVQAANLFWLVLGATALALVAAAILLLSAVFRKQDAKRKTDQPLPGDRRALLWVLIGGAAAPAILLIVLLLFSIPIENAIATNQSPNPSGLTIEVIGHQWWWEVLYPADDFETANEIHIPVNKPVVFQLTSADVVHRFWIPQLYPQLVLLPGQTNTVTLQIDQPGTYQGEATEFSGIQSAHMDFTLIVQTQAEFDAWVSQQKQPAPDPPVGSLEKFGQQAFLGSSCVYCHTIQGTNASGRVGPDLTHLASRATIGAGARPYNLANLAGWVINPQAIKPGNKMPPMDLDSDQLQAILSYLETLK